MTDYPRPSRIGMADDTWPARPPSRSGIGLPTFSNNHQRHLLIQRASVDLDEFLKLDNTISHLRGHIEARLQAYPQAARYDREGGKSDVELTSVERAADDRALEALSDLDHFLAVLSYGVAGLKGLKREFQIDPRVQRVADPNVCPPTHCKDHWAAGVFDVTAHKPYYKDRCRWCGEWFAAWTQRCPAAVIRIYDEKGRRGITSAVLRQHAPYALTATG